MNAYLIRVTCFTTPTNETYELRFNDAVAAFKEYDTAVNSHEWNGYRTNGKSQFWPTSLGTIDLLYIGAETTLLQRYFRYLI